MRFITLAFVMAFLWCTSVVAEVRVALVIGNSAYQNATALRNPANDARAVAEKLRGLGFEVEHHENLTGQAFRIALGMFTEKALRADIAAIFYAGHGIEMNGQNYLIPVDAMMRSEATAQFETISLEQALSTVRLASKLGIVMLDACRDNPFSAAMVRNNGTRSLSRGLAPVSVEGESGIVVSFAAQEGSTADDGDGFHSPYTEALLASLDEPGLEIGRLFRRVRATVRELTDDRQVPIERMQLPDEAIYLAGAATGPVVQQPVAPVAPKVEDAPVVREDPLVVYLDAVASGERGPLEDFLARYPNHSRAPDARKLVDAFADRDFWEITVKKNTATAYRTYLLAFSNGQYVDDAAARIAALEKPVAPEQPLQPPKPPQVNRGESGVATDMVGIRSQCPSQTGPWVVTSIKSNDTLFVRAGPGTQYAPIGELPFNAQGVSHVSCQSSGWCEVVYGCIKGYSFGRYLSDRSSSAARSRFSGNYRVTDHPMDEALNVRSGPGTDYQIVAELPPTANGIYVTDCQVEKGYRMRWCAVSWGGISGWSYGRYLRNQATGQKPAP
ncbi:MAG: caspase family protein [Rhodobacteraceae bacterium]|nr:caspase family protein [Paracoccaceae bacterium]